MDVYIEPVEAAPHLYLVGAGHVAYHLAQAASPVGFKVHVLDDREKFANRERFPEAEEVVVDTIPDWLDSATFPAKTGDWSWRKAHAHCCSSSFTQLPSFIVPSAS